MLKIAHIAPSFYPAESYGGPIRSTLQLNQSLARAGCQVRVLTTNTASKTSVLDVDTREDVLLEPRLSVRYTKRWLPESVSPALLAVLPEYVAWADVVHLTGVYNFTTIPTLLTAKKLSTPVVWSPRGALQRWENTPRGGVKAAFEWCCQRALPDVTCLHVTSKEEAQESATRIRASRTCLVPNGVFVPDDMQERRPSNALRILFLGRLAEIKGIENLIDACGQLKGKRSVPFQLSIAGAGDPAYTASLEARIEACGIADSVAMLGNVPDDLKADLMARHDVLVLPSYKENFGMVVAEALAYGVPVIASRTTPWASLEQRGCGLWVDNTPESLADALADISNADRVAMGERGHAFMREAFSLQHIAGEMLKAYHQAIADQERVG